MTRPSAKSRKSAKPVSPHRVRALIYDGLCVFEYGIVAEIFGLPRPELPDPLYNFKSIPIESGPLSMGPGLTLTAKGNLQALGAADTIIIPGWRHKDAPVPVTLCGALQKAHRRGARLVTICSGVYVLAAAGLLEGLTVTTHWRYAEDLAARYPNLSVEPQALYIEQGQILTSAGSSAGIDACLHLVRSDHGSAVANSVARRLVMHAYRQGDQAQYIEQPLPVSAADHRLGRLLEQITDTIDAPHTLASMAQMAGMSQRTFQRRFTELTGQAPGKWLTKERIHRARSLLESTNLTLEHISEQVGLSNSDALRYHFRQNLDISPASYRRRFKARA